MLNRTEEAGPAISEIDLARFERGANLVLPTDYRKFLLKHNGGRPFPADFMLTLGNETLHWRVHFFFGLNDPEESCCLRWNLEVAKETRPVGTLAEALASCLSGQHGYTRRCQAKTEETFRASFRDRTTRRSIEISGANKTTSILIAEGTWKGDIQQALSYKSDVEETANKSMQPTCEAARGWR